MGHSRWAKVRGLVVTLLLLLVVLVSLMLRWVMSVVQVLFLSVRLDSGKHCRMTGEGRWYGCSSVHISVCTRP